MRLEVFHIKQIDKQDRMVHRLPRKCLETDMEQNRLQTERKQELSISVLAALKVMKDTYWLKAPHFFFHFQASSQRGRLQTFLGTRCTFLFNLSMCFIISSFQVFLFFITIFYAYRNLINFVKLQKLYQTRKKE